MGWNVIKVIWGRAVGRAARPRRRRRARQQDEHARSTASSRSTRSRSGAYIREHFFGPDPRLRKMVEHLSDDELAEAAARRSRLPQALRGVQDRDRARGQRRPSILAKTVKGWTLGADFEARNATHQIKKMTADRAEGVPRPALPRDPRRRARERRCRPTSTRASDSPEYEYLMERRRALDGFLPDGSSARRRSCCPRRRRDRRSSPRAPARRCRRRRRRRSRGCCACS